MHASGGQSVVEARRAASRARSAVDESLDRALDAPTTSTTTSVKGSKPALRRMSFNDSAPVTVSRLTTSADMSRTVAARGGALSSGPTRTFTDDAGSHAAKKAHADSARVAYDSTSSACTLLFNISVDMTPT